jgi:hypothetical protein
MSDSPAIAQLVPLLSRASSAVVSTAQFTGRTLLSVLSAIVALSPHPLILHVLAPLIISVQILLDFLVFTPISIVRAVAIALYPIYVFVGVACIAGLVMGTAGRMLAQSLTTMALGQQSQLRERDAKGGKRKSEVLQ